MSGVGRMRCAELALCGLTLLAVCVGLGPAVRAAELGVKPLGTYPFALPGLPSNGGGPPKALLWCHGVRLLGVVVSGERRDTTDGTARGPLGPTAFLLRDGRCDAEGNISFGFLVPRKAWVYADAARALPEERTTWLLHRFEGSVQAGLLRGRLLQVDVSHPGFAFRESRIEVDGLQEDQASFADEDAWRENVARTFSVAKTEP